VAMRGSMRQGGFEEKPFSMNFVVPGTSNGGVFIQTGVTVQLSAPSGSSLDGLSGDMRCTHPKYIVVPKSFLSEGAKFNTTSGKL
jgi:hypothetical protein